MPTPNDGSAPSLFDPSSHISHFTCPPEDNIDLRREHGSDFSPARRHEPPNLAARQAATTQPLPPGHSSTTRPVSRHSIPQKMPTFDDEDGYISSSVESGEVTESGSSVSTLPPRLEQSPTPMPGQHEYTTFPESSDVGFRLPRVSFMHKSKQRKPSSLTLSKMIPVLTSSFLRPFSRFVGQQESDKQRYQVEVELKYVDMAQSSLCGYLKIEGKHLPSSPRNIRPTNLSSQV